jgi:protein-tyrosine phosphatase
MTTILVVCTGNICRSPIAEGFLRAELARRFGEGGPDVSSAGTAGWQGSPATDEGVRAAGELGVDITGHRARKLRGEMIRGSDLILAMATGHRDRVVAQVPEAAGRTFTLKELVRRLESQAPAKAGAAPWTMAPRIARAHAMRQAEPSAHPDEDVADPLGQPLEAYRAIAWELEEWIGRLVTGLYGPMSSDAGTGEVTGSGTGEPPRVAGA